MSTGLRPEGQHHAVLRVPPAVSAVPVAGAVVGIGVETDGVLQVVQAGVVAGGLDGACPGDRAGAGDARFQQQGHVPSGVQQSCGGGEHVRSRRRGAGAGARSS